MDKRNYAKPTKLIYECRNGREIPLRLPTHMIVCPTCEGRGSYVNPAIDEHGISPEQFAEDPDFAESYFRGDYDVTCGECGGRNVVEAINYERVEEYGTSSQKRRLRAFEEQQGERARQERDDRVTMYWESGGTMGSRS